ncbi:SAM-dependent methyltransferase [Limosilactobacillus fastidiosus]|uniref:SAM-dependent methyltransferase n=1 Tax=Limosilactobacillus fastidiosus TaxID=2759855 RepID=A0A7W3TYW1_9LACO|nr:SAM-dependent methyltransferase [Limosilactobacillus fastidiosus]MBB1063496.1 SAM-dependent methyltransferase [Limosilactobacillus fastidiosus]MBB1085812.1 SAM-dependent methyltransferase [Limosilactobacillus fastidiosus]MCD7084764.1 SAM-dependent methyltransferase [Limosilactobacillus fastidiosus]MCD7085851.1 SAM-dependent methyltransferase [Limosilactobacillus fastidiosus]MCD7113928.1 SAM-dependent methyltransferase [Limosilactobacillus fastidiosus]
MNPKQLKKLKKRVKKAKKVIQQPKYIKELTQYRDLFDPFPEVKFLINNVLESDRLLKNDLLPQPLPQLLLPDDIQDQIFKYVNQHYAKGDAQGDTLWNQYSTVLPKLDKALRNFRDYLEDTYGMWSYINAPFAKALSDYLNGEPVLEIMAGNGYISKGLRNNNSTQKIYTTDSQAWIKENETGKHPVTKIERLDAIEAIKKYGDHVKYVIMSWAPDKQETDWEVLQLLRKNYPEINLLVIGEKDGATNSKVFWTHAKLNQDEKLQQVNRYLHSFDLIDEQVYLVK